MADPVIAQMIEQAKRGDLGGWMTHPANWAIAQEADRQLVAADDAWISAATAVRMLRARMPEGVPTEVESHVARMCLGMAIEGYWQTPKVGHYWTVMRARKPEWWELGAKREVTWRAMLSGKAEWRGNGVKRSARLQVRRAHVKRLAQALPHVVRPAWWETNEGREFLTSFDSTIGQPLGDQA